MFRERTLTLRPKVIEHESTPAHDLAMTVDEVEYVRVKGRRGLRRWTSLLLIGGVALAIGGVGLHIRSLQWRWR